MSGVGGASPLQQPTLCIDYYTATIPFVVDSGATFNNPLERISKLLRASFNEGLQAWFWPDAFVPCNGMKRYPHGFKHVASGMLIHYGGESEGVRISLSGQTCEFWRQLENREGENALKSIVADLSWKPTRFDVAYDVGYRVHPLHIAEHRGTLDLSNKGLEEPRIKIGKTIPPRKDGDGFTQHIGSDASDCWCRVYLYEPPHPRAFSTRIEFQLRDDYAKQARNDYLAHGLASVSDALANKFEIVHPAYRPATQSSQKFRAARGATISPDTLLWLNTQVRSALARVVVENDFDLQAWIASSIEPAIEEFRVSKGYGKA